MTLMDDIASSLGVQGLRPKGGGGGSAFAQTGVVEDISTGEKYFYKKGSTEADNRMLHAEYSGVKEISETRTIRVPTPLSFASKGEYATGPFVVFEYLNLGGGGSAKDMGTDLAAMHRCFSKDGMYGWDIDNTIGATPQRNTKEVSWADFWCKHRFRNILSMCDNLGFDDTEVDRVEGVIREVLKDHDAKPSLLHGDLWGGNAGYADGLPTIFDPATYYGDRETDIAMTGLFGGFGSQFYDAYREAWPLPPGHEERALIYNFYHIANHYVLFGGGYGQQARAMMQNIGRLRT